MANLGTWVVDTQGEYEKISEITGIEFEAGKTYTMQVVYNAYIREGEEGEGFDVGSKPFQYTAGSEDLYIKGKCRINIAE